MKRSLTRRERNLLALLVLVSTVAAVQSVIIKLSEKEPAAVMDVVPKPDLDHITICTPTGTRVIKTRMIAIPKLRRSLIPEGEEHTRITILHDLSRGTGNGRGRVIVEFTPESKFPTAKEAMSYLGMAVPGGSVIEVTVDGKSVPDPNDQSEYDRGGWWFHYRLDEWERTFGLPAGSPSAPDEIRFHSKVVWSCESIEEDGYLWEGTYILKPSPEALAALAKSLQQHSAPLDDGTGSMGKIIRFGPVKGDRVAPIRKKHGLSGSTEFGFWRQGRHKDWVIGIDHEQGLVYWNWMDD